ncbi:hypothetical protein PF002_g23541 [Phytophthora fragariae]|uniref:Uncharacterized protein n=1 Tax=Phytophthora fragariae TaxID=53985 RepID=A0A6A4BYB9_9STRA|nr:hypothetical protein PF009_g20477 [Phytophthora fragariae]KAE9077654.1 hypothetical protein PF007_g24164 [Phytophthora fragariae]KAE9093888.1 hypothetical protein PF006_g24340 [Phytophthora fragariae]KAE9194631.1 hypothetical protein PF002_g23541 [Phytophthora fragariae]KAE9281718.1 hypothetical protein PF001_g23648 [Phytophthora fragariae]
MAENPDLAVPETLNAIATTADACVTFDAFDSDNVLDALRRGHLFEPSDADDLNVGGGVIGFLHSAAKPKAMKSRYCWMKTTRTGTSLMRVLTQLFQMILTRKTQLAAKKKKFRLSSILVKMTWTDFELMNEMWS